MLPGIGNVVRSKILTAVNVYVLIWLQRRVDLQVIPKFRRNIVPPASLQSRRLRQCSPVFKPTRKLHPRGPTSTQDMLLMWKSQSIFPLWNWLVAGMKRETSDPLRPLFASDIQKTWHFVSQSFVLILRNKEMPDLRSYSGHNKSSVCFPVYNIRKC
jgi:hypothetical protein